MTPIRIDVDLDPRITLAGCENAVPVIRRLGIENSGEEPIQDVTVRIVTDPAVADPWEKQVLAIALGSTQLGDLLDLRLSPWSWSAGRDSARPARH